MLNGARRYLKQAGFIAVDRHRPPMLPDISAQLLEVLLRAVMAHETSRQLRGSIIDHRNQVELLTPSFQPVMFTGVPLHQLAVPRPPGTPYVGLFDTCPSPSPQLGLDQPLAKRLPAHLDPVLLGQLFC